MEEIRRNIKGLILTLEDAIKYSKSIQGATLPSWEVNLKKYKDTLELKDLDMKFHVQAFLRLYEKERENIHSDEGIWIKRSTVVWFMEDNEEYKSHNIKLEIGEIFSIACSVAEAAEIAMKPGDKFGDDFFIDDDIEIEMFEIFKRILKDTEYRRDIRRLDVLIESIQQDQRKKTGELNTSSSSSAPRVGLDSINSVIQGFMGQFGVDASTFDLNTAIGQLNLGSLTERMENITSNQESMKQLGEIVGGVALSVRDSAQTGGELDINTIQNAVAKAAQTVGVADEEVESLKKTMAPVVSAVAPIVKS